MGLFGPKHALPTPPAIGGDRHAAELIRAWVARDDLHVVLRHDAFEDEAPWAVALVDIARHIAHAFQQTRGRDPDDVLRRLRDVLNAEWDTKRDDPEGSVTKKLRSNSTQQPTDRVITQPRDPATPHVACGSA